MIFFLPLGYMFTYSRRVKSYFVVSLIVSYTYLNLRHTMLFYFRVESHTNIPTICDNSLIFKSRFWRSHAIQYKKNKNIACRRLQTERQEKRQQINCNLPNRSLKHKALRNKYKIAMYTGKMRTIYICIYYKTLFAPVHAKLNDANDTFYQTILIKTSYTSFSPFCFKISLLAV